MTEASSRSTLLPPSFPLADLSLLFVAVIWGASYAVAKDTLAVTSVVALIFFRFLIASVVLLPVCLREMSRLQSGDALRGAALGAILSLIFLSETVGVLHTSATNAAFLISLCIIFTPILESIVNGRRLPLAIAACAGLSLLGTGLMVWKAEGISFNSGDLAILCAAALRAAMVVSTKRLFVGRAISSGALTSLQMITVMALSGALLFVTQGASGFVPPSAPAFWTGLLFLALFCTLAAFFIQTWAVRHTNPTRVSFLMGTEPVFGAVFAVLLLGEVFTWLDAAGAALILAGTYFGARLSSQ
ncbi:MAG: DMT family transporter [Aestuariivirga sp.]|uniref:DMT family transporter n=1 Tax=Aestuariivirga sp. TaxID=2650926 RepID=UPI0038CF8980